MTDPSASGHLDGCVIEHDAGTSDCYTLDDRRADEADRRYDEIKDSER